MWARTLIAVTCSVMITTAAASSAFAGGRGSTGHSGVTFGNTPGSGLPAQPSRPDPTPPHNSFGPGNTGQSGVTFGGGIPGGGTPGPALPTRPTQPTN
jgi:hypothetical protein